VARLAMFVDKNITNKKSIIKEIKVHQSFHADNDKVDSLQKRYDNWRNIYFLVIKKNSSNFS
jgi:replication fork clamp-binding protein CrfC